MFTEYATYWLPGLLSPLGRMRSIGKLNVPSFPVMSLMMFLIEFTWVHHGKWICNMLVRMGHRLTSLPLQSTHWRVRIILWLSLPWLLF
jgi:hypothetical protein